MSDWLDELAVAWSGGWNVTCEVGHTTHEHARFETTQGMFVAYDWRAYAGTVGYCPGDDELSKSLELNGSWEQYNTAVVAPLLDGEGAVIDIGAHIGWYTELAAARGHRVLAVDAVAENLQLLRTNTTHSGYLVTTCRGWIGVGRPVAPTVGHVRLLKCDIEGLEDQMLRVCEPLLVAGAVDHILMEVSPVFRDHYPDTVRKILAFGYTAQVVDGPNLVPLDVARIGEVPQFDALFSRIT